MRTETAALVSQPLPGISHCCAYESNTDRLSQIRSFEDIATLIRQLKELWLRGPLNTLGDSKAKQKLDENARDVAELLRQLTGVPQGQEAPVG